MKTYAAYFGCACILLFACSTGASASTSNLVLYYNFNTNTPGTALDMSGKGNHGVNSGAEFVETSCGGQMEFDGSNDYISIPQSLTLTVTNSLTMAAWFKVYNYNRQRPILGWYDGAGAWGAHMWTGVWGWQWQGLGSGANLVDTTGNENAYVINAANPAVNQWHHMAVTYDQTMGFARVYIDGVLLKERSLGVFIPYTACDLYVGMRPGMSNDLFHGMMDELRIYDAALSSNEVYSLFADTTNCAPVGGSATCVIEPADVRNAGAAWRLTSGPDTDWHGSGTAVHDIPVGTYTMTFSAVSGWTTPLDKVIEVAAGQTNAPGVAYVAQAGETNALVLYYNFDTDSGSIVHDLSGYGNDGALHGSKYVATDCGGMYELTSSNDYIHVLQSPSLMLSNSLSLAAWFKVYNYNSQRPILHWFHPVVACVHMWTGVTGWQWSGLGTGANLVDVLNDHNAYVINTANPAVNQWHHLAVTYDSLTGIARVYVDGNMASEQNIGLFIPNTKADLYVGGCPIQPQDPFVGLLDEIRIYKGAISSNDVYQLYAGHTNCAGMAGNVSSVIEPAAARSAGAQWRLTSGYDTAWQNSGAALEHVYAGQYTLEYKDITGWVTPGDCLITISNGLTTSVTGIYSVAVAATNSLLLHYTFDSDGDGMVTDMSGQGNHGSVTGATFVQTACGGVLAFDGTNDSIAVPASASLNIEDSLSLAVWFKTDSYNYQRPILGWYDGSGAWGAHLWTGVWGWQWHGLGSGANLVDTLGNESGYVISTANPVVNQWHHMAVTYDQQIGMARVYMDGILANEKYLGVFSPQTAYGLYIANRPGMPYHLFKGQLDDIRIYSGALSAADVYSLFLSDTNCEPDMASIACSIEPESARNAGARWSLTAPPWTNWNASGTTLANMEAGSYTVTVNNLAGWLEPLNQAVSLVRGSNTAVIMTYTLEEPDNTPPVIVQIRPPEGSVGLEHSAAMIVTVTDNVEVVSVTMNGEPAQTSNGHIWNFDMQAIRGSYNAVQIVVTDRAGNCTVYNVNYAQSESMTLASMWDGYWRVRNPYTNAVNYTWEVISSTEQGGGIALANSDNYFTTSPGKKSVRLLVDDVQIDIANSNQAEPAPEGLNDGSLDSDGDGVSNWAEEIAGSDINDVTDLLTLAPAGTGGEPTALNTRDLKQETASGSQIVFSWLGGINSTYTIQGSTDIANWFDMPDYIRMQGTGAIMDYTNHNDWTPEFYLRLKAEKLK